MDIYAEHIVVRKQNALDIILKVIIIISAIFLGVTLAIFFLPIGILGALVIFYLAYYLLTNFFNIEYEYIVTNGELDVDKIIAKKKRKHLLTVKVSSFEKIGIIKNDVDIKDNSITYKVSGISEKADYYAKFNHSEYGDAVLIFSPNDKILEAIKPYIPKSRWE